MKIEEELGVVLQLDQVDVSDPGIYRFVLKEDGRGVLHVESPIILKLLRACRCEGIDCLIAVVTGSSFKGVNHDQRLRYTKQCLELEEAKLTDSNLKQILKDTSGLIVYEEHISEVAHLWAGMELRRAHLLRRVLSEKQKGRELRELKSEFYNCPINRDMDEDTIGSIWKRLVSCPAGFLNRAHVAAYALEALQSGYLKKYYGGYFMPLCWRVGTASIIRLSMF